MEFLKLQLKKQLQNQVNKQPEKQNNDKRRADNYMKYSGMGIQMAVIVTLGALAGKKLDAHFQFETPWMTALLSLLGVFLALYIVLKDFFIGKK